MYEHTEEYDCHYQEREPYEVLYTKWLPYDDVLKLKDVEEMVEVYYNSGQFVHTLPMIERLYENPFDFFQELGDFYRATVRRHITGFSGMKFCSGFCRTKNSRTKHSSVR